MTAIPPDSGGGDAPAPAAVSARRRIGFRTVALVTYNDSDPKQRAAAAHASGSGQHGMLFRVNGVALWTRGANVRASMTADLPHSYRAIPPSLALVLTGGAHGAA